MCCCKNIRKILLIGLVFFVAMPALMVILYTLLYTLDAYSAEAKNVTELFLHGNFKGFWGALINDYPQLLTASGLLFALQALKSLFDETIKPFFDKKAKELINFLESKFQS